MNARFWIRQFLLALVGAFLLIGASHLIRGRGVDYAIREAALWAVLTAVVYTVVFAVNLRRRPSCPIDSSKSGESNGGG